MDKKDFIAIFKAETDDHLTKLNQGIVELEKNPDKVELVIKELNREAHTLKGSARVFGFYEIEEIAHKIEDIFEKVAQKKLIVSSLASDRIFKGLDAIRAISEKLAKEEKIDVDVSDVCRGLESVISDQLSVVSNQLSVIGDQLSVIGDQSSVISDQLSVSSDKKTKKEKPEAAKQKTATAEDAKEPQKTQKRSEEKVSVSQHSSQRESVSEEYIRVPLSRVDKLLNLVGEMVINKMKTSSKIAHVKRLSKHSKEAQKRLAGLSETIKKEFPIENSQVAKILSQCNAEIQKLRENALNLYENISAEAFHLDPVINELQARMKEIRMLPCSTIFEGFPRMIRDIASQEKKEVNLEISGKETELDKKILEGIKASLIHILRNCIDHGIEEPDKRAALGKPRAGTIKLSAYPETGNVVIVIEDDGRGMDISQIKQTALEKGLISREELNGMTEKEIKNIVFMDGFSTSPIITDVSGRGIGLDIVRRDIENLKGQVVLDTQKDKGAKFTIVLPLTIAIIQTILLKARGMLFALPMASVTEILKVDRKEAATIEGRMAIQVREHTVPLIRLDEVLMLPSGTVKEDEGKEGAGKEKMHVVIVSSLEKRVGFIVDEIAGEEELVIKSLGEHLGKVKNVSGAAILSTGEVVVILDTTDLIVHSRLSHPAAINRRPPPKEKRKEKRILVVEDALSTRELEKSMLETQGYLVDTAVDGLDALDRMTKAKYDLIVADIQMPRMDGFEFCNTLKKNDEYNHIPVVMVTALEKEEDKRRGIEAGAAAYIGKKAFDQSNLLDTIERLIG